MLERLRRSLLDAPVVKFKDYDYFVFPVADGVPAIEPELFGEVIDAMASKMTGEYDRIVTAEAMGIHLAAGLSLKTGIPFTIIRKRMYGLPGEVVFDQETGYSSRKMYINGLGKGERILLVDDVISTGGTLRGMLRALKSIGVEVVDVIIVISKGTGRREIEEEFGIPVKCLVTVEIENGRVKVLPE